MSRAHPGEGTDGLGAPWGGAGWAGRTLGRAVWAGRTLGRPFHAEIWHAGLQESGTGEQLHLSTGLSEIQNIVLQQYGAACAGQCPCCHAYLSGCTVVCCPCLSLTVQYCTALHCTVLYCTHCLVYLSCGPCRATQLPSCSGQPWPFSASDGELGQGG